MYTQDKPDLEYLAHYGVKGMKWGTRKGVSTANRSTVKMAKKDAKRFAEAKMFYGETAGTKRKLLNAELNRKKKKIPDYEDEFNKALENVDYGKAAKKAVRKRKRIDASESSSSAARQILGVSGPLTIAAASYMYQRNKPEVDAFVSRNAQHYLNEFYRMTR